MDFTGRYVIPAPPGTVWDAIQNPDVLKACIPGCESLEKTADNAFEARATLKIGPVKATFKGKVTLDEMDPPKRCILRGEGQGGVAGFAKGEAEVLLLPEGEETVLTYTAKANIGGKLAQIGQRLIDGAAKQIADDFFSRFVGAVAIPPVENSPVLATPGTASALAAGLPEGTPPPTSQSPPQSHAREVWVIGLIAVIVILLVLFGMVL